MPRNDGNRYRQLIEHIFFDRDFGHYRPGVVKISFTRGDLTRAAAILGIEPPKNLGDIVYSVRYRTHMPMRIVDTQPDGMEWTIDGAGRAQYCFLLTSINRIVPNPSLAIVKIPDATPEIISHNALNDEQALLARIRYNRLIDIFLGIAAYSLQSHMRTTVPGIGQIEIDEIYVGVDRFGVQYVVPVEAKSGKDQLSAVQAKQDLACCLDKFPLLRCRTVSAQFMGENRIALFELIQQDGEIRILDEKHYSLVPADSISAADLESHGRRRSGGVGQG